MKRIALLTFAALTALAQNWPAFRGPMGAGVDDAAAPPVQWNAEKNENIAWKTPIPGISVSSPVVWGDRIFVVTSVSSDPKSEFRHGLYGDTESAKDESKHTWRVICLDRATGKVVWDRVATEGAPKTKRHPKASHSSPSPVTDGKHVVAWFGSEGLYAYDVKGKLLWKKDLGLIDSGWFFDPDQQWGVASSPVIHGNKLILQVDQQKGSFIAAFDVSSGKELWRTAREEIPTWGTPVVFEWAASPSARKAQIVTNGTRRVRGYDVATGKQLWELGNNAEITCPTPVFANGLIYVTSGYPPIRPIYAIKWDASGDITLKAGTESNEGIAWSKSRGGTYMPSPLLYDGQLYLCSNSGVISSYKAATGEKVFEERVAGKGGAFSASPIASRGRLYLASEDGEVHVLKSGAKPELIATNPMGEVLMGTPAIAGDMIIVRGMRHVFAIKAAARPAD
jgi:hypothetical protein